MAASSHAGSSSGVGLHFGSWSSATGSSRPFLVLLFSLVFLASNCASFQPLDLRTAIRNRRYNAFERRWGKLSYRVPFLPSHLRFGRRGRGGKLFAPGPPKYFYDAGNTNVSGIHTSLTQFGQVIVIDRTDVNNTNAKFPSGKTVYAQEFNYFSRWYRPLDVKTNVFCSTGAVIEDGTLLSIGGASEASAFADPTLNGSFSVRAFSPCQASLAKQGQALCDFNLIGNMTSKRWYPTAQLLPDGRVMVVGGANVYGNIAINTINANNPTYEFWPRAATGKQNFPLPILTDVTNIPFNLYPFVHLLPSGNLFIFAGRVSCVLNYQTNQVIKTLPPLNYLNPRFSGFVNGMDTIMHSYPVTGTSAMLPLKPENLYAATIMICGGSFSNATLYNKSPDGACLGCNVVANSLCSFIQPEGLLPTWSYEQMRDSTVPGSAPVPRVMPDAVLLADDTVLIVNGAQRGFQGLKPTYASSPVRRPMIFDPRKPQGSRFTLINEDSGINRVYHSSALLMPDATVFISGSNPNPFMVPYNPATAIDRSLPTEFRTQIFAPPYLQWGVPRVNLTAVPASITVGSTFSVTFTTTVATPAGILPRERFRVVLVHPGFSTHSMRHGMRNVILTISTVASITDKVTKVIKFTIIAAAPPNTNIAPPTFYWLHVLDQGAYTDSRGVWVPGFWVPNVQGMAVRLYRKSMTVSASVNAARTFL